MIKIPAAGYSEGCNLWQDNYEEDHVRISQICISYKQTEICSLQFYFVDGQGNYRLSPLRGIDNIENSIFKVISLDVEKEFLIGLSGHYGCCDHYGCFDYGRCRYITSINCLTFKTNLKSYGPFGGRKDYNDLSEEEVEGSSFNLELGNVEVFNGFHGSSNQIGITSIGLFIKPRPLRQPEPGGQDREIQDGE